MSVEPTDLEANMRGLGALTTLVIATTACACSHGVGAVDRTYDTEQARIRVETFADGLSHPWGAAFMPDGSMLITERGGDLHVVSSKGELSVPVAGVPEVDARDQGGLLDVALDPDFASNRLVYLTYAEAGEAGGNGTAVARGELARGDAPALENVEVIFRQQPKVDSTKHFGSRLVFAPDGTLFVGLGERSAMRFRGQAQDLDSHLGKVVRINPDGSVPEDNPFVGRANALPEIWSYGHRNIQGGALHPETGEVWFVEHGPLGGDEINIPEAGKNYGWPLVSYGVEYSGEPVNEGESRAEGIEDPIHYWMPPPGEARSISPSGMAFYTANAFPEWQGDLFVGGLAIPKLARLKFDGREVTGEEALLEDLGLRIRWVGVGPDDGALYLLTDEGDDAILRVTPAEG